MSNTKMSDVFDLPLTAVGDYVMEEGEAGDYGIECLFNADAEAIALAVNSHDKLVEALEKILNHAQSTMECEDIAEAALLAIKGD